MQTKVLCAALAAFFLAACSPAKSASSGAGGLDTVDGIDYLDRPLSGKVFGQEWQVTTAVVKDFSAGDNQLSLELYTGDNPNACQPGYIGREPSASVVIPAAYTAQEYRLDIMSGTPVVFSGGFNTSKNVIADAGKLNIIKVLDAGFEGAFYAKAVEQDGTLSEINGNIKVKDCRKAVDFSIWSEFVTSYGLVQFDGRAVDNQWTQVESSTSEFYNRSTGRYVTAVVFPLFYSVSSGSSAEYTFGPLSGLGDTTVAEASGVKSLTYSYHGPITYKGMDITLNLDMTVEKSDRVKVTYTLEIPGHVNKTTHNFVLQ